ncbi:MAG: hypothetical protein AAF654_05090 [Myxococcota bacterium]
MSGSDTFNIVCKALERATDLTGPQVRGTVRLALKSSGLEASLVGPQEMRAVLEQVMPEKLRAQGIDDDALPSVLAKIAKALDAKAPVEPEGPASLFARLDRARKGN